MTITSSGGKPGERYNETEGHRGKGLTTPKVYRYLPLGSYIAGTFCTYAQCSTKSAIMITANGPKNTAV